jgi:hypothetical protein
MLRGLMPFQKLPAGELPLSLQSRQTAMKAGHLFSRLMR